MRRFAISDIHGCLSTIKALLEIIEFRKEDVLYILGDYIDRGPNSKGVIDYIWNLQAKGYQIHCTLGNHEQMLLTVIADKYSHRHGLLETINSFGVSKVSEIPSKYINWIHDLPYYLEIDGYLLVHAGLKFGKDPLADKDSMIWIRDWHHTIDKDWLGDRIIVHGHTPITKTEMESNLKSLAKTPVIDIDAGCVFNYGGLGHLCALNLDALSFTFVKRVESVGF